MNSVLNSKKLCKRKILTHIVEVLACSLELYGFLIGRIYIFKGLHEDNQIYLFQVVYGLSRNTHIEGLAKRYLGLRRQSRVFKRVDETLEGVMESVVVLPYCSVEGVIHNTIAVTEGYLDAEHLRFALVLIIKDYVLETDLDLIQGVLVHLVLDVIDVVNRTRF